MVMGRKEVMQELRGLLRFFVYCMDKHEVFKVLEDIPAKEDGTYRCAVLISHDKVFITLRTKKSKTLVHTISIRYDYMYMLDAFGWYFSSMPYKRGKPYRFLENSMRIPELTESSFDLMLRVVSKDAQLRSLQRLLKEWQEEATRIYLEVRGTTVDGVPMELSPTGYLRDAVIR